MTSGQVHVVPSELGHWTILDGHERAHSMHPTRTDAERAARQYATHCGASEIVLHDRYGRVHRVAHEQPMPPLRSTPMRRTGVDPSYLALRVNAEATATEWWAHALKRRESAPAAIAALLNGRTRVEVTTAEATHAIQWALRVPGWNDARHAPVYVYAPAQPQETVAPNPGNIRTQSNA